MKNIFENIKDICLLHPNINSFYAGDIFKLNDLTDVQYPCIWLQLENTNLNYTRINSTVKLFYVDRILDDSSDSAQIEFDATYILNDIINSISEIYQILETSTVTPFSQKFNDMCAGAFFDLTINDCVNGTFIVNPISPEEQNLLPSEYVSYSGTTLKDALDSLDFATYTTSILSLSTAISGEIVTRGSADISLSTAISSSGGGASITSLSTAISSEVSTRGSADTSLSTAISGEVITRGSADTSLSTAISSEIVTRGSADTSLSTAISSEIVTRGSADTSLSTGLSQRVSVDTSLSTAISGEVVTRGSADTSLSTAVSQRVSVDTSLSTAISGEVSTRGSADTSLSTAISGEIVTRGSANTSLEVIINTKFNQAQILRLI